MKSIISFMLASTLIVSNSASLSHESKTENVLSSTEKNYSLTEFKNKNTLYSTYKKFVNHKKQIEKYSNDPFEEITSVSEKPNITVIDHYEENGTTSAIFYDDVNNDYYYLETSENASNMLMSLNNEDYLINNDGDNILLESSNGEELSLVETYYDEYFADKDFDWIIKETSDITPYASWNLISSGNYYNSQNLMVTVLSIIVSVVTSGVASAYLQIGGVASRILGYIGIGWTVGQTLTQNYLIYTSQWTYSSCSVYYKTKYDYYVIPKSASGSTVTSTRDFYKYQYTLNANPSSPPAGCTGLTNRTEGPYSYH